MANENNSVPASVPNTTFSPLKTTAIATLPTSGRSSYLIPPASASSGDGVGFIVSRGRIHKGVDVRCPYGTPIVAPGDGVVVQIITGYGGGYGNHVWMSLVVPQINQIVFILVAHGADGSIKVSPGQKVSQEQTLMLCGATGHSSGPHLHFECHISSQSAPPSAPSAVGITVP